MTSSPADLLAAALREPVVTRDWHAEQWSTLLRQARAAGLLARVLARIEAADPGARQRWPAGLIAHAEAADRLGRAQHREIFREVRHLAQALEGLAAPVVLLKGAAYVMSGLPPAAGRVFSDIDIMVPKPSLAKAEAMLMAGGWMSSHHSSYDQRYYRQWMHELPPMQHVQRGTTLDVHHTILPETARLRPPAHKLFEASQPLQGWPAFRVLAPADMLLHSMTHLFMNDDMTHALRDLSDMDLLIAHFADRPGFWDGLVPRARELDLTRPLFYGLRWIARTWGRPIPEPVQAALRQHAPAAPLLALMDSIWSRALHAAHSDPRQAGPAAALAALYLRGHWLRMPPLLLSRHLAIKALGLHTPKLAAEDKQARPG